MFLVLLVRACAVAAQHDIGRKSWQWRRAMRARGWGA